MRRRGREHCPGMRVRLLPPIVGLMILVAPAAASAAFVHSIVPGESLYSIAAADGLSVSQLAAANGLAPGAQLTAGSSLSIPPQTGPTTPTGAASTTSVSASTSGGDPDGDGDETGVSTPFSASVSTTASAGAGGYVVQPGDTLSAIAAREGTSVAQLAASNGISPGAPLPAGIALRLSPASVSTTASVGGGGYVVQPGDTLSAIAAREGTSVAQLAASNGIDPGAPLPAGIALRLSPAASTVSPAPSLPPAIGASIVGRMTWFGGPHDPSAQGIPASGLGWRTDGMSYYNNGSLGHHWVIHFPWGQTLPMTQIDLGPAPWTGNPFDIAFSALPNTPFSWRTWPNPVVTGTYQGG
jgi:LysM repeat protein